MKISWKKVMCLILALVMALSLAACARGGSGNAASSSNTGKDSGSGDSDGGETVIWRVGHNNPEDHYWSVYINRFAELVDEKSNGTIKVELYANAQLGDDNAMGEMIRNGNLDEFICGACIPGNWYEPMKMMEMAGLFDSWEHVERAIYGEPGELMKKGCEEAGFILWDNWMRTSWACLSNKPIESLDDFANLKTRVPGTDVWVAHMEGTYGLSATPIAFSEVFTSLQQGVVNAVFNPISSMYTMRFHELCDYLVITNANYDFASIMVSNASWDNLSDDQKAVMQECEDIVRAEVNEYIKTEDDTYIALMKEENPNLKVVELDNTELLAKGQEISSDVCALEDGGQELWDAIRACA